MTAKSATTANTREASLPGEVVEVTGGATGELVVQVQSIHSKEELKLAPLTTADHTRLPEVKVTIEREGSIENTFGDSQFTSGGRYAWPGLPRGWYRIEVSVPEGYGLSSYQIGNTCVEKSSVVVEVRSGTNLAACYLYPRIAAVEVIAFWDQQQSGRPDGQPLLEGVTAGFYRDDQELPSIPLKKLQETLRTCANPLERSLRSRTMDVLGPELGRLLHDISHPENVYLLLGDGLIQVTASSAVYAREGQRALNIGALQGMEASLFSGKLSQAHIPYVESLNEIEVVSYLVAERSPDAVGGCRTEPLPLPNVGLALYRGNQQGEPFREGTSTGSVPHLFSDLLDGNYTVVASTWPASYASSTQIRPLNPVGGVSRLVSVSGGRRTRLRFLFAPSQSTVTGLVTENLLGRGVPGVALSLLSPQIPNGPQIQATTNSLGEYEFQGVAAGSYLVSIREEKVTLAGGRTLEVPSAAQNGIAVLVPEAGTLAVPPIVLQEEIHKISGTARASDGSILPFLRIEIQDQAGNLVVATQTDQTGYYEVLLKQAGSYLVVPRTDSGLQIPAQVNSVRIVDIELPSSTGPGGLPTGGGSAKSRTALEAEIDNQAYPVLTEEVPTDVLPRSSSSAATGRTAVGALGTMAENAIRDVLSWRTKTNDPKSFRLALNQSFSAKDVEGHTEFTWTPRTYTVQTDMGAITGAQASIYNRAKVALDQSLPLLDGLYALIPALDQQDMDSVREMVRSLFTELVSDFGIEGGPRVPRVDQLFEQLLGSPLVQDTEKAGGQLGLLRERFGLRRDFITTIADEQNLTNYLVLVDYVIGLANSWNAQKRYFTRSGSKSEPYFGTQLVLLSRSLDVVAQSVKDLYFAMDSVFLGASERQTILLDFSSIDPDSSMYVAELLEWIDRAVSEELPRQLQDSGKDAISTLKAVLRKLHDFVVAAAIPQQAPKGLPPGYRTPRVQRALRELAQQLNETYNLANQVRSPRFPEETRGI